MYVNGQSVSWSAGQSGRFDAVGVGSGCTTPTSAPSQQPPLLCEVSTQLQVDLLPDSDESARGLIWRAHVVIDA